MASSLGLLLGGVLYGMLDAAVFLVSAAVTGVVFLLAFRIARTPAPTDGPPLP